MSFSDYNSKGKTFTVDNSEFPFVKLRELIPGREYPVLGLFVTPDKNGYGEGAVIIIPDYNVNVPGRLADKFRKMMDDDVVVQQINNGKAAFSYSIVHSDKYNHDVYHIEFIDK